MISSFPVIILFNLSDSCFLNFALSPMLSSDFGSDSFTSSCSFGSDFSSSAKIKGLIFFLNNTMNLLLSFYSLIAFNKILFSFV